MNYIYLLDRAGFINTINFNLKSSIHTGGKYSVQNDQRFDLSFGNTATSVKESDLNNSLNIFTDKNQIVVQNKSNSTEKIQLSVFKSLKMDKICLQIKKYNFKYC